MKPFYLAGIAAMLMLVFSCNKDENKTNPTPVTPAPDYRALIRHDWNYTGLTTTFAIDWDNDGDLETDLRANEPACYADNLFSFNTDTTYRILEGATKCDPSAPDVFSGAAPWKLDYPKLTLDQQEWTIEKLDDHNLIFYNSQPGPSGEIKLTFTLTR